MKMTLITNIHSIDQYYFGPYCNHWNNHILLLLISVFRINNLSLSLSLSHSLSLVIHMQIQSIIKAAETLFISTTVHMITVLIKPPYHLV